MFKSGPRAFDLRENYFDKDNKLVDRVRKDLVGNNSSDTASTNLHIYGTRLQVAKPSYFTHLGVEPGKPSHSTH